MIKKIFLLIFFIIKSYSDTDFIMNLQDEFQKDVILMNAYKKRYSTYLHKICKDKLNCYSKVIKNINSWDTVKNDKLLNTIILKKQPLLTLNQNYWKSLLNKLQTKKLNLNSTQFLSVIDLSKQMFIIVFWNNELKEYFYIGQDLISSGNMHREIEVKYGEDHYLKTPSGVFKTKIGWRSEGKINNDNVTLGYGQKGRYIFYFGNQESIRYNSFDKNNNKIYDRTKWKLITDKLNFAVHAHKSSRPMGTVNSHGCIRMTDELNRFLDSNSVLHKHMFIGNKWINKYSKKPINARNTDFAGEYLIVFEQI